MLDNILMNNILLIISFRILHYTLNIRLQTIRLIQSFAGSKINKALYAFTLTELVNENNNSLNLKFQ